MTNSWVVEAQSQYVQDALRAMDCTGVVSESCFIHLVAKLRRVAKHRNENVSLNIMATCLFHFPLFSFV